MKVTFRGFLMGSFEDIYKYRQKVIVINILPKLNKQNYCDFKINYKKNIVKKKNCKYS